MSEILLPMFSPRILMVSGLIFKSLIHFEFIIMCGVRRWLVSFLCTYLSYFPNTIYWIDYFYPIVCSCFLCQILIDPEFISGSLFCSIDLCVCFYASTVLFWLRWLCNTGGYQVLWSLLLCSSFSKLLQLFGVVYGSIWISEMFVLYLWNMSWVL